MKNQKARVLVVDDYEPWRHFVSSTLHDHPEFLIVEQVEDGLPAVEKAQELSPDLILLDIGLPKLNGLDAARRIREVAPHSKILIISENRNSEIIKEALRRGAGGYVVKSQAVRELLPAMRAVLQGKQFISGSFGNGSGERAQEASLTGPGTPQAEKTGSICRHEVCLYSEDGSLIENVTQFIGAALKAGNAVVVVATELHRKKLRASLEAEGLDINAAIEQGRYLAEDAAKTVSSFLVDGMPDRARFLKAWGDLILTATKASKAKHPCIAVYGEGAGLLWAQGKEEAAIQIEKLGNELIKSYDVDILCSYSLASVEGGMDSPAFQPICATHSAAHCY